MLGVGGVAMETNRTASQSTCGVCGERAARYTCPACVTRSCSLLCVKKHKEESGCSGLRDKTAFVALSKMDEMNLLSDYRFLEDTTRLAGSSSRDRLIRAPKFTCKAKKMIACAKKVNITLKFLPATFTKSRENSTIFLTREKRFLWHLKLIFPQSNAEFSERRVSDGKTIEEILTPYVHPAKSDPVKRQKLKMYAQATFEEMKVFMRVEGEKANSLRYHELHLGESLQDNLSYKMLIEFPELHIVLRSRFHDYPLKGAARPVSDRVQVQVQDQDQDQGTHKAAPASPSCARQSLSASPVKREVTDEIKPPREKRAKRDASEEEELEEGELTESSEEEQEEEQEKEEEQEQEKEEEQEQEKEQQGGETENRNVEDCHAEEKSQIITSLTVANDEMSPENSVNSVSSECTAEGQ